MSAVSAEIVPEPVSAPLTDLAIALVADPTGTRIGVVNARGNFDTEEAVVRVFCSDASERSLLIRVQPDAYPLRRWSRTALAR